MRNAGLEEAQAGIKIARRNLSNLRYADDINSAGTLRSESETQRKPEVPASPRGEALFRCAQNMVLSLRLDSGGSKRLDNKGIWDPIMKDRDFGFFGFVCSCFIHIYIPKPRNNTEYYV